MLFYVQRAMDIPNRLSVRPKNAGSTAVAGIGLTVAHGLLCVASAVIE